ncbi:penicillin-binding transpeptidase domain-containing protein [Sporosarcina sp. Te-1]|uniref:penicillin-binding transpeptidase domain-containing protein n=1 Tax=Sporosarcina sp. Te-1 TaxID=2818390 RepID=UPI001A9DB1AD|nr:penicillin-binding transpeptidase domain-containing protein [Sporosarcina sp. Te-1]QTD42406.1 PASTA domain-containing protein [Sporosarcina sp. Te-1]
MFVVFGGLFFLLMARFLSIQITGQAEGRPLAAMAASKYARENVLKAERGEIVDRNGELIASDTLSYRLFAVISEQATPKGSKTLYHVVDYDKTAEVLSHYIPMSKEEIQSRMQTAANKEKVPWQIEFGKAGNGINHETMEKIQKAMKKEGLTGVNFMEEKKRFYPNGNFASYLIGFAMREEQKDGSYLTVGKMGLEKTYDKELTGVDGKVDFQTDFWGFILPKSNKVVSPPQNGNEIHLTLDKTIQNFVEDAMTRVEKEYSPKKMLVIVANPKTGEIYAMSQRPSFHPGTREGLTENWLNEAVETTIEPGSTMKMFTLAAAIEENKWDPAAKYNSGQYKIYDRIIRDHNRVGWGPITFLEGFQRSSNVSMAYLLERLGDRKFIEYLEKFGFGEKVGIDLPHEAPGYILDSYPSERLTTSYGQGSTVTPIQMIQAATAIANDGVMMKPYVIDEIINPNTDEIVQNHKSEEKGRPISKETAKKVREILASTVTSEVGTGRKFALPGYDVGGKTGTAEIPDSRGKYLSGDGNYLYSFLGMAPIDDPQLVTYVLVQQPQLELGEIGSDPVSKVFKPVMESSLKYLNILPENVDKTESFKLKDYIGKDSKTVMDGLGEKGIRPVLIGEGGEIAAQYPSEGTKLTKDALVLLRTAGKTRLPDFTGWSKKMVLSFKQQSGLDIRLNGDGFVTEQSLSPGTVVNESDPLVIMLQPPKEQYEKPEVEDEEEQIIGG